MKYITEYISEKNIIYLSIIDCNSMFIFIILKHLLNTLFQYFTTNNISMGFYTLIMLNKLF